MQSNPIVVDGIVYATTPKLRVIALDAATGREIWSSIQRAAPKGSDDTAIEASSFIATAFLHAQELLVGAGQIYRQARS